MRSTSVPSKSVTGPWWLVPELVDWECVARQVDFYRIAEDFEFKWSSIEVGISSPWWRAAQWTLLVSFLWGLAAWVAVPHPLWMLPCAVLVPLVAIFCTVELTRCTLNFAARAAQEEAKKAVRVWGAALAAAAPGDSRDDDIKRAYQESTPSGALSQHAIGMVLRNLGIMSWDVQEDASYLDSNFREAPPRWMNLRQGIYRLIEPLTRVMKRSRQAVQERKAAETKFEGEAGLELGHSLFPWARALSESRTLGASCSVPLPAARRARL